MQFYPLMNFKTELHISLDEKKFSLCYLFQLIDQSWLFSVVLGYDEWLEKYFFNFIAVYKSKYSYTHTLFCGVRTFLFNGWRLYFQKYGLITASTFPFAWFYVFFGVAGLLCLAFLLSAFIKKANEQKKEISTYFILCPSPLLSPKPGINTSRFEQFDLGFKECLIFSKPNGINVVEMYWCVSRWLCRNFDEWRSTQGVLQEKGDFVCFSQTSLAEAYCKLPLQLVVSWVCISRIISYHLLKFF